MIRVSPQNGDAQRYVVSGRSPLPRWWVSLASPKAIGARGHKLGQNPVLSEKAGSEIFSPNPLRAITGLNVKLA